MIEDIQAAIPLGFFLSFMLGPVFFVLIETSITKGIKQAIILDLGVLLADIIFITLVYFSSYQLLDSLSNVPGIYIFGGTILSIYGAVTFLKTTSQPQELISKNGMTENNWQYFVKGFFLNFINIGVLLFWLGVLVVSSPGLDHNPQRISVFFGTILTTYFLTDIVKIFLSKQLKKKLTYQRILIIKKALGCILVICGIVLICKGLLPSDQLNPKDLIHQIKA